MWSAGFSRFRLVHSIDRRNLLNSLSFFQCVHSMAKQRALYLYNSSTRAELYLIGTDHVSPRSAELVDNLITDVRPSVVAVELCEQRAKKLLSGRRDTKPLGLSEFFSLKGSLRQKLITYVIRNMYADLAGTGLKPGEELKVAVERGEAVGATISYMDQRIDVIVKRAAQNTRLIELLKYWFKYKEILKQYPNFFKALSYEDIFVCAEAMLKPDALKEAMEVGERFFPGLVKALLHERNEHMVKNLRNMKGSIVGVVGALHVPGMEKLWQQAELECGRK